MTRRAWVFGCSLLVLACQAQPIAQTPPPPPALVEPYVAIGTLLAADQTEGIAALGAELATAAQAEPGLDAIAIAAAELGTLELEPARARYRDISHALLPYFDAHPDQRRDLTLAYCPMTFANHGGYWLQRGEPLMNPYEGARMLHCGALLSWDQGVGHRARWAQAHATSASRSKQP